MKILISACLLGLSCRYDGKSKEDAALIESLKGHELIPICPEIFGGLPTPREACEISCGRVVTEKGTDMTAEFRKGAEECMRLARILGAEAAVLKDRSPSCGVGVVHNGRFDGGTIAGDGFTSAALKRAGLKVFSVSDVLEKGIE